MSEPTRHVEREVYEVVLRPGGLKVWQAENGDIAGVYVVVAGGHYYAAYLDVGEVLDVTTIVTWTRKGETGAA